MKRSLHTTLVPALLVAAASFRASAQTYTITALPLLSGGDEAIAYDINNLGVVTGEAVNNTSQRYVHAVRWSGGTVADLGALSGGFRSHGFSITDGGLVTGASEVGGGGNVVSRGMYRQANGNMTELPGTIRSQATAANNSGQIAGGNGNGQIIAEAAVIVAVIWNPPSYTAQNQGSMGGRFTEATAINDGGMIVGRGLLLNGPMHAFSKAPAGPLVDLGTLGGRSSEANSVNNAGRVAGWAEVPSGARHAVRWEGKAITDLGTLPSAAASEAFAVNGGGDIVGTSWVAGQGPRAWVVRDTGSMTDLNSVIPAGSGWVLQYARGINDAGRIVGQGRLNGKMRAFLLTPITCYANCDGSTGTPLLTANDFQCFLSRYAANDPNTNCDGSTGNPALTPNDFQCFINAYAAGCS